MGNAQGRTVAAVVTALSLGMLAGYSVGRQNRRSGARYGSVIRLRPDHYEEYKDLHSAVWPGVLKRIYDSNIRNFTIYHSVELSLLFSHFEYVGEDFAGDMARIGEDPETRRWWAVTEPCQQPLAWEGAMPSEGGEGSWWTGMQELFHCGHPAVQYQ